MKKIKKQLSILIITSLVCIILLCSIVIIVDPFFVYHKPLSTWHYTIDNQLEQNPGIARHFDYDSVMLGSSMTTNFDTLLFDEALGTQMVKLSYNAAYPKDIYRITDIVAEEKNQLSHVFLCIDIANYMYEPDTLSYPYPEHLYDKNPFNDVKYLLNKDVLFTYIIKSYLGKQSTPVNEMYWHWKDMIYNAEHVLNNYSAQETETPTNTYTLANLEQNLTTCIAPYVEAMPDTQFHIFFPPYSMLYWHNSLAANDVDTKIDGMMYVTEFFMKYANVDVHYFQNEEAWICDLNNYTDTTHFSKQITDEMTQKLCNGANVVSEETYEEILEQFRKFVKEYDYEMYFTK